METNNSNVLMSTFGTQLKPINTKEGLFVVKKEIEVIMDTPLPEFLGAKKLFKKDEVVKGTLWQESSETNMSRKVVMVQEGSNGRYLINKKNLEPTTEAKVLADISKKEIEELGGKIDGIIKATTNESENILNPITSPLDKEYYGFTGKQILVATLGVIILIKIFK